MASMMVELQVWPRALARLCETGRSLMRCAGLILAHAGDVRSGEGAY